MSYFQYYLPWQRLNYTLHRHRVTIVGSKGDGGEFLHGDSDYMVQNSKNKLAALFELFKMYGAGNISINIIQ